MNLAYFKKSKFSKEVTIKSLKEIVTKNGLTILGEVVLPQANGLLLQVCSNDWVDKILKNDKNLVGLMPCSILVAEKNGEISVGAGNPTVLGGVTENQEIHKLAIEAEDTIRKIINEVTGAGSQKPSKIKLYSTTTCPYCIMEKKWLDSNKVEHEVIYVDKNQAEAEKMVKETGQMGVPVTEIVFDEGESEYIIGFNKLQLAKVLGISNAQ